MSNQINGDQVLKFLDLLETVFPYKVQGRPETYSTYNEAWCDAIDRVRGFIEEKINE